VDGVGEVDLKREELKAICYEVARSAMWARRPVDVDKITELAGQFERIATDHCERVISQGRDPNLITRAVQYLGGTLAPPPMGRGASWFHSSLETLIGLACPPGPLDRKTAPFLDDLAEGISRARPSQPQV
jgi:hypothetical protein